MERIVNATIFLTALGSGLMAGLFFIFSVCIMTALGRLTPASGIAAMQSINVVILNGIFLSVFMGTALLSLALIAAWFLGWVPSGGMFVLAGSLLYLVGIIGVTMFFNVPMNNALAAVNPDSSEGAALWKDYLVNWTMWNHARTIAGIGATGLVDDRFPRLSGSRVSQTAIPRCPAMQFLLPFRLPCIRTADHAWAKRMVRRSRDRSLR